MSSEGERSDADTDGDSHEDRKNEEAGGESTRDDVLEEIQRVIESVAQFGEYRRTHRKESHNLVRRLKLMLPLMEELRDLSEPVSEKGIAWLRNLRDALVAASHLLRLCSQGSKIHLAVESEAVMITFQGVYEKLCKTFDCVPCEELGLSDEIQEQLELLHKQLRRARRRNDTQDIELAMDMMVVFSDEEARNADSAMIERLAKNLELQSVEDIRTETIAIRNLASERNGEQAVNTQRVIDVLNKFKKVLGMEETSVLDDPVKPKTLEKCTSLIIPHEFLCPITLDIMTDPVIIASGQTFERESIEKWFKSNHDTCPKTRQPLAHLQLAPNHALKNLITEWCQKNNINLTKDTTSDNQESSCIEEIPSLVQSLSSFHLEEQRKAVEKIRMIAKENPEKRVMVGELGGIPPLVQILSYPDSKLQEHAVTALLNLSIDDGNKKRISNEGAIPSIIEVLTHGSVVAKENSAAALFSLSMLDDIKEIVGASNGIPPLVELLKNGTIRGKKDAVTALFNLSLNNANKVRAISAGIVPPLLHLVENRNLGMVNEALSIILLLVQTPEGRQEIGQLPFIETLVGFMREGNHPKTKECACSVLLELCSHNSSFILAALQFGVYEDLIEIKESGTSRARRKANSILDLIKRTEQI